MATGTATLSDSFFLASSGVFGNRVKMALLIYCNTVSNEVPTGLTGSLPNYVHTARKNMASTILNPVTFNQWLTQFVNIAAADANLVAAATQATTNYTPITSTTLGDTAAADGQTPLVTTVLISNAIAAAFDSFISSI